MKAYLIVGIVLIVAWVLALAYGGFTYTKNVSEANGGSLELPVNDKEAINVPIGVGVGSIGVGDGMLLLPTLKHQLS